MLATLVLGSVTFLQATRDVSRQIVDNKDVYTRANELGLRNAVVFVKANSGRAPVGDLPRNGLDFDHPPSILCPGSRGRQPFAPRDVRRPEGVYVYEYEGTTKRARLVPFLPSSLLPRGQKP